eukprot:m.262159 g.262159  ORF g.262159 m.262159 type:complete len:344 (+) comp16222_c1_seq4:77-1108(+)
MLRPMNVLLILLAFHMHLGKSTSSPKTVFAHYMMCFHAYNTNCTEGPTCGYQGSGDVEGYVKEISYAAQYGLDGFALEWLGSESYYRESYDKIFEACEIWNSNRPPWATSKFYLLPILDTANWTDMADKFATHANSSCTYKVGTKPFISSWGGGMDWHNATKAKGHVASYSTEFIPAIKATGHAPDGPFYLPFMFPQNYDAPPTFDDVQSLLSYFPDVDGLWYWGCAHTGDIVANASIDNIKACRENNKYTAAPVSAPYSPHRAAPLINGTRAWSNIRYFTGNGAKGMITTWMAHIASQPDFVIYTTWNDLAEHHYLGPYNHTFWGLYPKDNIVWHTAFPHTA